MLLRLVGLDLRLEYIFHALQILKKKLCFFFFTPSYSENRSMNLRYLQLLMTILHVRCWRITEWCLIESKELLLLIMDCLVFRDLFCCHAMYYVTCLCIKLLLLSKCLSVPWSVLFPCQIYQTFHLGLILNLSFFFFFYPKYIFFHHGLRGFYCIGDLHPGSHLLIKLSHFYVF